jgi:hypothetical protein
MITLQMASPLAKIVAGAKRTMKKLMGGRRTRKAGKAGRRHRRR